MYGMYYVQCVLSTVCTMYSVYYVHCVLCTVCTMYSVYYIQCVVCIGACQNTQSWSRTSSSPANPDNTDHVPGSAIFVNSHSFDSVSTTCPTSSRVSPIVLRPLSSSTQETSAQSAVPSLPDYSSMADPFFVWGSLDGPSFSSLIRSCYDEVVHWRRNIFKIPSGKAGTSFVRELARLYKSYADSSALESVALYAVMVMPLSYYNVLCVFAHQNKLWPTWSVTSLYGQLVTSAPY